MRGKWWVALLALIAFPAAMAALTLVMDKRYTAAMRLLATQKLKPYDTNSGPFASIDDISNSSVLGSVDTTVQILTGTEVLGDAILRTANKYPKAFQGDQISDKYESLIRRLAIDSGPTSDVISVRVTMDDPEIAADVANNIGFAFIDYVRKMESEAGNSAIALIKKNLDDAKTRLAAIDAEIRQTKEQSNIADQQASGTYTTSGISQAESKLSELEGLLGSARAAQGVAEAILSTTPAMLKSSVQSQVNPALLDLENQRLRLEATIAALKVKYMDDADEIQQAQKQLTTVTKNIASVKQSIEAQNTMSVNPNHQQAQLSVANAKAAVAGYEQQVIECRKLVEMYKAKSAALPGVEQKLNDLMRQRVILENTYAQLQQRKDVIEQTGSGRKSPAKIVSTALTPTTPSFPDVRLFTLIGLAIGFVVAALVIMPKGDTDLYGQWPQNRAKGLKGKSAASVATTSDAPALGDSEPDDKTQA